MWSWTIRRSGSWRRRGLPCRTRLWRSEFPRAGEGCRHQERQHPPSFPDQGRAGRRAGGSPHLGLRGVSGWPAGRRTRCCELPRALRRGLPRHASPRRAGAREDRCCGFRDDPASRTRDLRGTRVRATRRTQPRRCVRLRRHRRDLSGRRPHPLGPPVSRLVARAAIASRRPSTPPDHAAARAGFTASRDSTRFRSAEVAGL